MWGKREERERRERGKSSRCGKMLRRKKNFRNWKVGYVTEILYWHVMDNVCNFTVVPPTA